MKRFGRFYIHCVALVACSTAAQALSACLASGVTPRPAKAVTEDAAIFGMLVTEHQGSGSQRLIVQADTMPGKEGILTAKKLFEVLDPPFTTARNRRTVPTAAINDWKRRNRISAPVPVFHAKRPVTFASGKELHRLLEQGGWRAFYKRYGKSAGMAIFSRPGYSTDGSSALVFYVFSNGPRNGGGFLYHVNKVQGKWKVIRTIGGWRS